MIKIAIVEDDLAAAELLKEYLIRFQQERQLLYDVQVFRDALSFLNGYTPIYDVVFMDIEMPHLIGTDAAKRLREIDPVVALVFVTNMAQYAINGYEVDAVDYVLKPVTYYRFSTLLQKILRKVEAERDRQLPVQTPNGFQRLNLSQVSYVSVEDHLLLYHVGDQVIEAWGTLKAAERELPKENFVQCNKSCIVNLKHVRAVSGEQAVVGHDSITISRGRKKEFMNALNAYFGR